MYKVLTLARHNLRLLFGHRAPDNIRAAERIARNPSKDLHDLLLINHTSKGHVENILDQRRPIRHMVRMRAVLKKPRNGIHRSRAVKRYGRDDHLKVIRPKGSQHPAAYRWIPAETRPLFSPVKSYRMSACRPAAPL